MFVFGIPLYSITFGPAPSLDSRHGVFEPARTRVNALIGPDRSRAMNVKAKKIARSD
jgi:hypothetical protein